MTDSFAAFDYGLVWKTPEHYSASESVSAPGRQYLWNLDLRSALPDHLFRDRISSDAVSSGRIPFVCGRYFDRSKGFFEFPSHCFPADARSDSRQYRKLLDRE